MVERSRTKNSISNTIWGLFLKGVSILLPFANRTLIIRVLGMEYVGVSGLFSSILSVLNMAELGMNSAILYSLYGSVARKDLDKTRGLLFFYRKAYHLIALIIFLVGISLTPKIGFFITGEYPENINIYFLYLIYLLGTVNSYLFGSYRAIVFSANQREDIIYKIGIFTSTAQNIIQFLILLAFHNFYWVAVVSMLIGALQNVIVYFKAKKMYPEIFPQSSNNVINKNELLKQISGLMIGKFSVVSRNSFDSILISMFLGLNAVAVYGNYYYVMISVFGIIFHFCNGIRTSVGNKIASSTPLENYADMMEFSFAFYLIYSTCSIVMVCLYQPFMQIWVGEDYMAGIALPILMSIYFFFYCSVGIISIYWEAAGLFWENKIRYIIEALINLTGDFILVKIWGLNGIILATIISMLLCTNIFGPQIIFKHYFKDISPRIYYRKQIRYAITTLISGMFTFWLCYQVRHVGLMGLIIKLGVSTIVGFTLVLLFSINTLEGAKLSYRIENIVGQSKMKIIKRCYMVFIVFSAILVIMCFNVRL